MMIGAGDSSVDIISVSIYIYLMDIWTISNLCKKLIAVSITLSLLTACSTTDIAFKDIAVIQRKDLTAYEFPSMIPAHQPMSQQMRVHFTSPNFNNTFFWFPEVFLCDDPKRKLSLARDTSIHNVASLTYDFYFKPVFSSSATVVPLTKDASVCFCLRNDSEGFFVQRSNKVEIPKEQLTNALALTGQ